MQAKQKNGMTVVVNYRENSKYCHGVTKVRSEMDSNKGRDFCRDNPASAHGCHQFRPVSSLLPVLLFRRFRPYCIAKVH